MVNRSQIHDVHTTKVADHWHRRARDGGVAQVISAVRVRSKKALEEVSQLRQELIKPPRRQVRHRHLQGLLQPVHQKVSWPQRHSYRSNEALKEVTRGRHRVRPRFIHLGVPHLRQQVFS